MLEINTIHFDCIDIMHYKSHYFNVVFIRLSAKSTYRLIHLFVSA